MPKVTIVMTSYNKAAYVAKSIESILNQTLTDFEFYLMDDNSNEETLKVIEPYLKDKRIRFMKSDIQTLEQRVEKVRYSALINQALQQAKGEYISYATDDNCYRNTRLEQMVDYLEENPEVMIAYSASMVNYLNEQNEVTRSQLRPAKKSFRWPLASSIIAPSCTEAPFFPSFKRSSVPTGMRIRSFIELATAGSSGG